MGTVTIRDPGTEVAWNAGGVTMYDAYTEYYTTLNSDRGYDYSHVRSTAYFTHKYSVIQVFVTAGAREYLESVSIQLPFYMSESTKQIQFYGFLFDGERPQYFDTLPSGALASSSPSSYVRAGEYGEVGVTFTFSGLQLETGSYWMWVSTSNYDYELSGVTNHLVFDPSWSWDARENVTGTWAEKEPYVRLLSNAITTDETLGNTWMGCINVKANDVLKIKYGSTVVYTFTFQSDADTYFTFSQNDRKGWFTTAGITSLQSMTLTAIIEGHASSEVSFTLTAGNNMKPTVGAATVTIVQTGSAATNFPNTYIANVSKAKVEATVAAGSNASVQTVVLSYGTQSVNMTYNSTTGKYEATTPQPITGNVTFTVTATDQRGMAGTSTYSLTGVVTYTKPSITIDSAATFRCDDSGNPQIGGPYVRVKATATYDTGLSGNALTKFLFYVQEDGSSNTHNLTSGTQSQAYALLSPRPDNAITVVVVAQDKVSEEITRTTKLAASHRDVLVRRYKGVFSGQNYLSTQIGIGKIPAYIRHYGTARIADGVDVPELGGYFIDGRDVINYLGTAGEAMQTGSTKWSNDFLAVDWNAPKAAINETVEFTINSSELTNWSNIPPIGTATNGFVGIRMVVVGWTRVYVIVLERLPVMGRIWINTHFRSSEAFYIWQGWTGHTPDIT